MKRLLSGVGIAAVVLCLCVPANAQNLLTNPGFEQLYAGWNTFGGGAQLSLPSGDNIARTDTVASKLYGEFTGCPGGFFTAGGYYQEFTVTPGALYDFSGWGFMSSADPIPGTSVCSSNRSVAQITFYDDDNFGAVVARNDVVIADFSTPIDTWVPFEVSMVAPTVADRVRCHVFFFQPACDTGSVFIDDLVFTEDIAPHCTSNMLANPSFDTDLSSWTTFGNAFYDARDFARYTPTGGAKMFGPFSTPGASSGMYQGFPATPGETYWLGAYSMTTCEENPIAETDSSFASIKLVFTSGGVETGSQELLVEDMNSNYGNWSANTISAIAPAGTDSVFAYLLFIQNQTTDPGAVFFDDVCLTTTSPTAIPDAGAPARFTLKQNVPNPFNPTTSIAFELDRADEVELAVYDATGRRIATLAQGSYGPGPHSVTWDGRSRDGKQVASGVYWYALKTSTGMQSKKMVLLK